MRFEPSSGRVRFARPLLALVALAAALVVPAQAAANHYARSPFTYAASPLTSFATAKSAAAVTPVQWCGNDVATGDRFPDGIGGSQVHVVYAYPADRPNRLGELAGGIATDLAAIDAWWRRHDSLRAPRWDTFPFPGCAPGFGGLDITVVRLPRNSADYDVPTSRDLAQRTYGDLVTSSLGKPYSGKKYLVLWDAPAPQLESCAFSVESVNTVWYLLQPPQPGCPPVDVGQQTYSAMVTAHELVHNLGASRAQAPHNCMGGHVCDDARDVLYGIPTLTALEQAILDVGNDDYYGHSGTWTDIQDSPFLVRGDRAMQPVSVALDPPGGGTMWSVGPGIQCPIQCSVEFEAGTRLTLQTQALPGYRFAGWSGGCSGRLTRCRRTVSGPFRATARFAKSTAPTGGTGGSGGTSSGSGAARNRAPRAKIARLKKSSYETSETVSFASTSTDTDGKIAAAAWDFGDGARASGASASHVYTKPGRYRVVLQVTDDRGAVGRRTRSLLVRHDPPRVSASRGFGRAGRNVALRYRVSDRTALRRLRLAVYVGRNIVLRRSVTVAGLRYTYGSVPWRVRATRKPLSWCAQGWDVFGHTTRTCAPIRVY